MSRPKTKRFHGALPEESYAIVKEAADRVGMSVKSFVSMATIRYALELKREFENIPEQRTLYLSLEGSEHFTRLMEDPENYFGKTHEKLRRLAKRIDIKA